MIEKYFIFVGYHARNTTFYDVLPFFFMWKDISPLRACSRWASSSRGSSTNISKDHSRTSFAINIFRNTRQWRGNDRSRLTFSLEEICSNKFVYTLDYLRNRRLYMRIHLLTVCAEIKTQNFFTSFLIDVLARWRDDYASRPQSGWWPRSLL